MKNVSSKLCLIAAVACVILFVNPTPVFGADENRGGPDERLQRLERRINELTERQNQMMQRPAAPQRAQQPMMNPPGVPQGPQGHMPSFGPENMQPEMPQGAQQPMMNPPGFPQGPQGPMPSFGPEHMQPQMPQRGWRPPMQGRAPRDSGGLLGLVVPVWIVCNILLAIWIFTDIRKRGEGAWIFIALALVAGIPAAIIYSLVRIGDKAAAAGK